MIVIRRGLECSGQEFARGLCFAGAKEMLTNKREQKAVSRIHLRGTLQSTSAAGGLLVFDQKKALNHKLLERRPLRPVMIGYYFRSQLVATIALFLRGRVLLTTLLPHTLELFILHNSIFGQQANQRFQERAIEIRVLGLT